MGKHNMTTPPSKLGPFTCEFAPASVSHTPQQVELSLIVKWMSLGIAKWMATISPVKQPPKLRGLRRRISILHFASTLFPA